MLWTTYLFKNRNIADPNLKFYTANTIDRVAASRKSFIYPLCAGSNPIKAIISFSSFLLYYSFICTLYSFMDNSFNIYTKRSLNFANT